MDLTNPANWSVIYEQRLQAMFLTQHGEGNGSVLVYEPIGSKVSSIATPVGLVKCYSPTAMETWYTGCYFNAYLNIANQKTRVFNKKCSLKGATPIFLPQYNVVPYEVEFYIPKWIDDITIVLYQYTDQSGKYDQINQQAIYSAIEVIEQRQNEIKNTLGTVSQQLEFVVNRDVPKNYDVDIQ
jgi:hypothetical protein